jgi:hypothetical protein
LLLPVWRPFTTHGPFPPEIEAIDALAGGIEAYNVTATHLRDRWLVGDAERTIRDALAHLDRALPKRARRMTPVGGSDSHGSTLRATTFVLATERTADAIGDALRSGRVCVRDPAACSLEARAPSGEWLPIGSAIAAAEVQLRARGEGIELWLDGRRVATPASQEVVTLRARQGACSVIRARVEDGFSAPIYLNCN